MTLSQTNIGAAGGVRHDEWVPNGPREGRTRGQTVPNEGSGSSSSRGWVSDRPRKTGERGCLRPPGPPLLLVRPTEGVLVLPGRRRLRGSDPGGPRRALQGDP